MGPSVIRLCNRLGPGEDPAALARDTLEAALAGMPLRRAPDFSSRWMRSVRPSVRYSVMSRSRVLFSAVCTAVAGLAVRRLRIEYSSRGRGSVARRRIHGRHHRHGRQPADRAPAARHRFAPCRRTGRGERRDRGPHHGDTGRARHARRGRRAAGQAVGRRDLGPAPGGAGECRRRSKRGSVSRPATRSIRSESRK